MKGENYSITAAHVRSRFLAARKDCNQNWRIFILNLSEAFEIKQLHLYACTHTHHACTHTYACTLPLHSKEAAVGDDPTEPPLVIPSHQQ